MFLKMMHVGDMGTNCYIFADEKTLEAAVVDPGGDAGMILSEIQKNNLKLKYILLTHGHFDHTTGVNEVKNASGAKVYIHRADTCNTGGSAHFAFPRTGDITFYDDGDVLTLGSLNIEVMHTPGHSPGSCVLKCQDVLFTGDTLFCDSCGRTDFSGGSYPDMLKSLKRLYLLEGDYKVYPGHESVTSLDRERRVNYYMLESVGK